MKKRVFLGIALLLVVGLLSSCSGVKQADLDAALADKTAAQAQVTSLQSQLAAANTAKTAAEAAVTTANAGKAAAEAALASAQAAATSAADEAEIAEAAMQVQVDEANAKLADAQAALDAANAQIELLKASSGAVVPPTLTFTATEYTDATNKFVVSYNKAWTVWAASTTDTWRLFGAAMADYNCPGLRVCKIAKTDAADVAAVMKKVYGATSSPTISKTENAMTNPYKTTADGYTLQYTASDGFRLDGKMYIFQSGDFWWTLDIYQANTLGTLAGQKPDEVFSTWRLTK
ncbi:MAG: hypothetical protein PHE50_05345 [Dehalococcoidales bacterium]|nr:hypothetical protein [Dehalococcoidales bacterium]